MLLRLLVPPIASAHSISQIWRRDSDECIGWLSRSSWSLALIALWRRNLTDTSSPSVWLPDYFCDESLSNLRSSGAEINFYPIKEDLSPDFQWLRLSAKNKKFDVMVIVHYFGRCTKSDEAREFCHSRRIWLVEDATHVLRPTGDVGCAGDFVIYSPHKIIAVPDGAVLVARTKGPSALTGECLNSFGDPANWWRQFEQSAFTLRVTLLGLQWLIKRISQKLGVQLHKIKRKPGGSSTTIFYPTPRQSTLSRILLIIATRDLDTLSYARERNKILLEYVVGNSCLSEVLSCPGISAADNFTPYLCCFHIKGKLSTLEGRLADYGIPGLTWPGLPYKILTDEMLHHVAVNLERNKYFIPVNQPLDRRTVAKLLGFEQDAPEYEVAIAKWNGSSTDWNTLLSQVDFSNVLQSWEYGDAKALSEGWCVERFAISHRGGIIGCFQVLTKRYLGIISVNRINRGPLFLAGTRTKLQESAYLEIRRRFGKIQAGRLLFWAPESAFTGGNLAYFRHIGFYDRLSRGWCSSVIDLTSDVEVIQGRLNGKWRNSLRDAQRRNLVVTLSNSESDFTLLIDKCNETLSSRGVKFGRSLNLILRQLLKRQRDRDLHLIATAGGEVVASVYLVTHGVCATYLLGWNSSGGRDLRAHHLLLWESIRQLKLRSIRSFDVGGVDEVTTPSIASFKLGLGGAQYRLVGEGLCY